MRFLVNSYPSQHVPKSTRTNFWSTRIIPDLWSTCTCPKSTRTRVKKRGRVEHDRGRLVSLGPNKPFQTLKHHILLFALRLGSCQPVQRSQLLRLWGSLLGACSIIHHTLFLSDFNYCTYALYPWRVGILSPHCENTQVLREAITEVDDDDHHHYN